ncbi:MFS transporter [Novosphingobium sp. FKTRR1]|uniref:MFS transporter n=1 Tax=Novosphingobium sp. FKTRR1 TaxID=2879118 RepID=UPI001CF06CCC|nr:MFS transporter [Novosphingobium sp. FKTRR1]
MATQFASATAPVASDQVQSAGPRPLRLLRFAAMVMPLAAVEAPLTTYVPPLYASLFGLSLPAIGAIFLLARLWDAVIDPAIGLLSDRTRSRFGRRRPWIVGGSVLFALGAFAAFLPPPSFGPFALSAALFVLYLGYSMIATPLAAWTGELSAQYHERTRIATYAMVMTALALLLALVLPSLLATRLAGQPAAQLAAMGAMVFLLLTITLPLGLGALPEPEPAKGPLPPLHLRQTIGFVLREKLLLRVLASNGAVRLGQGIRTALFVFFVAHYMNSPALAPALFLYQYVFGILACPIWLAIGRRVGKGRAAVAGELLQMTINLALLLVAPGGWPLLLALTTAQGLAQGSGNLMLRSIVADVADAHRLETGHDRIGLFFSVFSLSDKAGLALAVGIALPLVGALGFDPNHASTASALFGLKAVFALGPAIAHLISAAIIHGFPIDEERHGEIRRALAARDAAGLASDASHDRWLADEAHEGRN